jgi:hypothetical protein
LLDKLNRTLRAERLTGPPMQEVPADSRRRAILFVRRILKTPTALMARFEINSGPFRADAKISLPSSGPPSVAD